MIKYLIAFVFTVVLVNSLFAQDKDPVLTVTDPVQNSTWLAGSEETVTWSSEDVKGKINILLSTDGGNSFPIVLEKDVPDNGMRNVQVPEVSSSAAVIRLESEDEKGIFDLSGVFRIEANASITVTEPSASSVWIAGTQRDVVWSSENITGNVNIKLSTDGGATFPVTLLADIQNDGSENVLVPENLSTSAVIRVESSEDNNVFGLSAVFRIESQPSITVSEPSASSIWIPGTQRNVVWSSVNIPGNVNIKLSTDGGTTFPVTLLANIQNDGSETILVPDNLSTSAVIRVEASEYNFLFGLSAVFRIESQPSITVNEPSAASVWIAGTQRNVAWSSENIPGNVNIKLSTDGGTTFPITLFANIQNDGSETITVPDNPSPSSVIRVEAALDNSIYGLSAAFKIESQASITVTEPSALSVWTTGTQHNVVWSSVNVSGNVNIKLSINGGTTFPITLLANIQNDGSETITVPDNASITSVIRVESVSDNNIFGLSGIFKIQPVPLITVSGPAAGAKWVAGTQQNVIWSSVNVPGNVNIKLSTNGGITFPYALKSNVPNDGSESVQVPEAASSLSVIRVESASNTSLFGHSAVFTIESKPSITVSEPTASDIWFPGTQQNVVWSTVNLQGNVNIKLSVDGGATFPFVLKQNIPNDGAEEVQVPDNPSAAAVIRIEAAAQNAVFGLSGTFIIESRPSITVTEPMASSEWVAGTQQNVSWSSVNIQGNVNIKLSTDGGATFTVTLKSNSSNDGTEVVDVPNNPSSASVIKVESAADNSVSGNSQSFAIIVPRISVSSPAAGQNWAIGSRQTVTWKSENLTGTVNIKLSLDGGSTFPVTLKSNTRDDGSESVTVPDNASASCVIKVESSAYNDFFGLSTGTFTISAAPQITVITPSGDANWTIGSQQTVSWSSVNISGNVNIKLSTDGGVTFPVTLKADTENDGSEIVVVPDNPSSASVVKVESVSDNGIFGSSERTFTITSAPTISVTKPESGENWITVTQQTITWTSVNISGNVNIRLSTDGGNTFSVLLAANTLNDGIETIQVPDITSDDCRIRIESVEDNTIFGLNPGAFTISPVPSIQVTQPDQNAEWIIGTQQTVSWISINVSGAVNILLSTDGGNTFQVILKSGTPNDGSEVIDVPDNASLISRIKVESAEDNSIFGLNPGNFTIKAESKIVVLSPVQSAKWTIGSEQTVTWNSEGVSGNVNIRLSTDGGNTFPVMLKSGTGNDGSEKIIVPDNPSETSRIMVESVDNNDIFGVNPGNFIITSQPVIIVTSPAASDKWTIGSDQTITWTSEKVTGTVNILLSTDGGNTFPVILKSAAANDGSEVINVPDNASETCRIKVESVSDKSIFGLNPGNFTITTEPTITVTAPLSSEKWLAGSSQTVEWNSVNVTGNVSIVLSADGGNTFSIVLKSETANDGSEIVEVPANASVTCRIKVESVNDVSIFGLNPGNFEITQLPSISVMQPAASVIWAAGSRQTVTWNGQNLTGNVNIRLSTDGGSTFPALLKSNTPNDGSETINVPAYQSQNCRIKVESAADTKIFALNPGQFRITSEAAITITSPGSQAVWIIGAQKTVTWTSANLTGTVNIMLSTDGGSTFPVTLRANTPNDHSAVINVPDFPSDNCRIRIESSSDKSIFAVNDSAFAIVSYPESISISTTLVFEDHTDGRNSRIIGIPGSSTVPINITGEYVYDWQVFWDNGKDQDYLVSGNNYSFSPGKAYWIVSKNPVVINQEVEPVPLSSSDNTYSIPLHRGWNLISNPFEKPVSWTTVRALNGLLENQKLYYWNGSWDSLKSSMIPYEGYYFNNSTGLDSLKLPYQPAGVVGKTASKEEYPANISQFLSLRMSQKGRKEISEIFIGFDKDAKDDYDGKDYFAPPGDFLKGRLSLLRRELPERERHFFIEQRSSLGEGQQYDIEVRAVPNELQQIEIAGLENYEQYNIYLLDERLNNFYNIRELKKLELKLAHEVNPFKLIIGSDEYINSVKQNITPAAYELFQNYPNPFNPSTVLRFSLPEANTISISIYNSIGELVEVLVNEQLYDAGYHEVMFNGAHLSSGMYIVDLRTQNFRKQNKMLLVK